MIELELFEFTKIDLLRLIHFFVCFGGAAFMVLVWQENRTRSKEINQDLGLLLIACALVLWSAIDLYRLAGFMTPGHSSLIIKTFSAYNNAFLLASLPFFHHGFSKLKEKFPFFKSTSNWALGVMLFNVLIVLFYSLSWTQESSSSSLVRNFDVCYSAITFMLFGYALQQGYAARGKKAFAWLSTLVSILLVGIQFAFSSFVNIKHYDLISVLSMFGHFSMIMLVIVLAKTWIAEVLVASQERLLLEKSLKDQDEANVLQEANRKKIQQLEEELRQSQSLNKQLAQECQELKERQASLQTELHVSLESKARQEMEHSIKELSEREIEVLAHINKSYSEIGDVLCIARDTVISHKKNIESKLGLNGKEQLLEYAQRMGILKGA